MKGISRKALYIKQGGRCHYCTVQMVLRRPIANRKNPKLMTKDHMFPKSTGGLSNEANFVGACLSCNSFKGDMYPTDFRRKYPPKILLARHEMSLEAWEKLYGGLADE